ncbi:Aste57867_6252 [Aphanomyces stellatus]|uniref:Aste57867_6252 protein n=1 Tax=Aphanomyces stellatus TaxID=120398 RepID=A0A485KHI5_9STRA|nr:hypothetical protein As57867_006238 [Aphanomyces stellatus]VFT83251.1 Aste57867_6252 [Aphanomyces stellatus]
MRPFAMSIVLGLSTAAMHNQARIMGGHEATVGQHLYVASLRQTPALQAQCGGSLIAPTIVLTAAHCLGHNLTVASVGSHFIQGVTDGEHIPIVREIQHPQYDNTSHAYDVAVLVLDRPSIFPPAQLSFATVVPNMTLTVRGWGRIARSQDAAFSYELLEVNVQAVANAECASHLRGVSIERTMLCAGGDPGRDACQGDSGGPLTLAGTDTVVGVVSFGRSCGQKNIPGVYARLSFARKFLQPFLDASNPKVRSKRPRVVEKLAQPHDAARDTIVFSE